MIRKTQTWKLWTAGKMGCTIRKMVWCCWSHLQNKPRLWWAPGRKQIIFNLNKRCTDMLVQIRPWGLLVSKCVCFHPWSWLLHIISCWSGSSYICTCFVDHNSCEAFKNDSCTVEIACDLWVWASAFFCAINQLISWFRIFDVVGWRWGLLRKCRKTDSL